MSIGSIVAVAVLVSTALVFGWRTLFILMNQKKSKSKLTNATISKNKCKMNPHSFDRPKELRRELQALYGESTQQVYVEYTNNPVLREKIEMSLYILDTLCRRMLDGEYELDDIAREGALTITELYVRLLPVMQELRREKGQYDLWQNFEKAYPLMKGKAESPL